MIEECGWRSGLSTKALEALCKAVIRIALAPSFLSAPIMLSTVTNSALGAWGFRAPFSTMNSLSSQVASLPGSPEQSIQCDSNAYLLLGRPYKITVQSRAEHMNGSCTTLKAAANLSNFLNTHLLPDHLWPIEEVTCFCMFVESLPRRYWHQLLMCLSGDQQGCGSFLEPHKVYWHTFQPDDLHLCSPACQGRRWVMKQLLQGC